MLIYLLIGAITAAIILHDIPVGEYNLEMYLFTFTGIMIGWPILAAISALQIILTMLYNLFTKNPIDIF